MERIAETKVDRPRTASERGTRVSEEKRGRQRWSNFERNRENGLASLGNGPGIHRRQRARLTRKLGSPSVFRGRPPGYEKYEIWFSRVVNGYTALCVYIYVCIYIYFSLVLRPGFPLGFISFSVYRRSTCVSWEDLGGPLSVRAAGHCPLKKRANRSWRSWPVPFSIAPSFFSWKNPFPRFFVKINHVGTVSQLATPSTRTGLDWNMLLSLFLIPLAGSPWMTRSRTPFSKFSITLCCEKLTSRFPRFGFVDVDQLRCTFRISKGEKVAW